MVDPTPEVTAAWSTRPRRRRSGSRRRQAICPEANVFWPAPPGRHLQHLLPHTDVPSQFPPYAKSTGSREPARRSERPEIIKNQLRRVAQRRD